MATSNPTRQSSFFFVNPPRSCGLSYSYSPNSSTFSRPLGQICNTTSLRGATYSEKPLKDLVFLYGSLDSLLPTALEVTCPPRTCKLHLPASFPPPPLASNFPYSLYPAFYTCRPYCFAPCPHRHPGKSFSSEHTGVDPVWPLLPRFPRVPANHPSYVPPHFPAYPTSTCPIPLASPPVTVLAPIRLPSPLPPRLTTRPSPTHSPYPFPTPF